MPKGRKPSTPGAGDTGAQQATTAECAEYHNAFIKPILAHMHLVDLHQVKFASIRSPAYDQVDSSEGLNLVPNESIEVKYHPKQKGAVAMVTVGVRGMKNGKELFSINAIYRSIYTVKDSYTGDQVEERVKAFCRATSLAHVWPYWRESLSAACARMGVQVVLAPLLIVGTHTSPNQTNGTHG